MWSMISPCAEFFWLGDGRASKTLINRISWSLLFYLRFIHVHNYPKLKTNTKILILYLPLLGAIVPRFLKMCPKRAVLLNGRSRPLGSHSVGHTAHFYRVWYWICRYLQHTTSSHSWPWPGILHGPIKSAATKPFALRVSRKDCTYKNWKQYVLIDTLYFYGSLLRPKRLKILDTK